jgi:uncharacterized protein (DUF885 family)
LACYTSDLDRLGALGYDAWRAARLVVDSGLHGFGWSGERAATFLAQNTMLSPQNISNETDRYIVMPGQALAYKTGQLEILRLRATAERELGSQFDVIAFHSAILGAGPLSLPALADRIQAYIANTKQAAP